MYREISNMAKLRAGKGHPNVLALEEVLEYVQPSQSTIFLALEIANGGELFDRIKVDEGCEDETACLYMHQLLSGVSFCHSRGVCHRDLKPENLLLADHSDTATLKIADFGLSAIFGDSGEPPASDAGRRRARGRGAASGFGGFDFKRLKSVVGSPHYVAPEILQDDMSGYDGQKADVWSAGVIMYAMLAGNLPFAKDLLNCQRFEKFCFWARESVERRSACAASLLKNFRSMRTKGRRSVSSTMRRDRRRPSSCPLLLEMT